MPALTVGMATYDDFDGVWFTIQALRLYQDLTDVELLVVDNYGCDTTRDFLENWTPARYVRSTDVQGTAAPRDLVFREASGDAVLCCDSHVMFEPGVIARLKDWFATNPGTVDLVQGPLVSDDLGSIATHFEPVWRAQMWGIWETDPRGLDRDGEPFEIPMQGLGAFACRREVWPGFNPRFSGFGGEEGYLHEKFRQAGGRTLCLPWLRWSHRFGRPKGVTYRNTYEDRLRNYVIGHAELGLDIAPAVENFSDVLSQEQIQRVVTEALWPESSVVADAADAGGLEEAYGVAAATPSDINEHLPKLRELAEQCERVTEFGTRSAVSTTALAAGRPKRLTTYDVAHDSAVDRLRAVAAADGVDVRSVIGDVLVVDIEPTDLLLIDTLHTAGQLEVELARHAGKVRRWIVLHDTSTFGETGQDGGPGLLVALRRFLAEQPDWRVVYQVAQNNGLTVIERDLGSGSAGEGDDWLPFLVALCPTYRRRRLVANAVACFEGQDYPAERRRLLVLDDFGDLGSVDAETWSVVSESERLPSLPAKYARLAELATKRWPEVDAFVIWEDDDVYLPGHLRAHGEALRPAEWSKPSTVLSTYGGTLHEEAAAGRFFASIAFRASLLERVGGFVQTARGDFDQQFLSRLEAFAGAPGDPAAGRGPGYVFRWEGTEFAHAEAFMTGPDDETWYAKAGEAARADGVDSPGAAGVAPLMDDQSRELWRVHETASRGGEPLVP